MPTSARPISLTIYAVANSASADPAAILTVSTDWHSRAIGMHTSATPRRLSKTVKSLSITLVAPATVYSSTCSSEQDDPQQVAVSARRSFRDAPESLQLGVVQDGRSGTLLWPPGGMRPRKCTRREQLLRKRPAK